MSTNSSTPERPGAETAPDGGSQSACGFDPLGRAAFLAKASSILNSTLDYDLTLERIAQLAVPEFADWCAVDLADEDLAPGKRVAVAHIDPEKVKEAREAREKFPPDPHAEQGLAAVLRSGRSERYEVIPDDVLENAAQNEAHLAYLRDVGMKSAMIVPMVARGRTLGALTFVSASDTRHFSNDDLETAEELAQRAALAVDNARLFRETQRAWRSVSIRAAQQQAVAEIAQRALEVDSSTLFREALERLVRLLNADAAKLVEFSPNDLSLVLRASVGWGESWHDQAIVTADDDTAIGYALRHNEVVVVDDFDESPFRRTPMLQESDIRSAIGVHLPGAKSPIGVLEVQSRRRASFSKDDAALLRGFSNVLSAAVEKERAEQQREHMYQRLTDAVRSREELLSIVSHDLRSPAAAVKLNLELLSMQIQDKLDDAAPAQEAIDKASANIDRMVSMMDDLLGSFRDDAEQLSLTAEEIDFCDVVRSVVSSHERDLLDSGTPLELKLDGPLAGRCDRMRFEQIVSNLLSNAIKYGQAKPVTICVKAANDQVQLRVTDRGVGIAEDQQDQIFERFRRADDQDRSDSYGLGLWIVKRVVDAMNGSIAVESVAGEGTSITVSIPRVQ